MVLPKFYHKTKELHIGPDDSRVVSVEVNPIFGKPSISTNIFSRLAM